MRKRRAPKVTTKFLAASIQVLHKRISKLERAAKQQGPHRPIGFEYPDVVHGDVIPQDEEG
jgi:hypothetical protein